VLKNLRAFFDGTGDAELVEHAWLPHAEFVRLVCSMDICMQVSFTETYNIVAADSAYHGVPIVVSPDIRWANCLYRANPNRSDDMVGTLRRAWWFRGFRLHWLNKLGLLVANHRAKRLWHKLCARG